MKPPRMTCATQPYTVTSRGKAPRTLQRPVAFCNAYAAQDGRRAVVVVNATGVEQTVTLDERGTRRVLRLAPDEIRLLK